MPETPTRLTRRELFELGVEFGGSWRENGGRFVSDEEETEEA